MKQILSPAHVVGFFAIFSLLNSLPAFASEGRKFWSEAEVEEVHRKAVIAPRDLQRLEALVALEGSEIHLPVSQHYNQGPSDLCWGYAAMNLLDTRYLVRHPQAKVEISRTVLQYIDYEDRLVRKVYGMWVDMERGGATPEAIDLIRNYGATHFSDYTHEPYFRPNWKSFQFDPYAPKLDIMQVLYKYLASNFSEPPKLTHSISNPSLGVTPKELAAEWEEGDVKNKWVTIGNTRNGHPKGWGKHWSISRLGYRAYYEHQSEFPKIIDRELKLGHPVGLTWCGHEEMIFGAGYDANGMALYYEVKGSFSFNGSYPKMKPEFILGERVCGLQVIQSRGYPPGDPF